MLKPEWRKRALLFLLCSLLGALCSCHYARKGPETLPRPTSAYMRWMQKESLQTQIRPLIAEVSQSERVWLQSANPERHDVLAKAAPNWLVARTDSGEPLFRQLVHMIPHLAQKGIYGIYLGDTGEKPRLLSNRDEPGNSSSLAFDQAMGSSADFENLAEAADKSGLELGSTLLAGATGQGPDFLLQARMAPEYGGLYAMLPLPAGRTLPPASGEWGHALADRETMAALADIAPAELARDSYPWASPGGWAITGEVACMDGQPRRWLYRYHQDPSQPVMAWQDPSGQAARILSAAVIRNTGLLGQSLTGLSLEPLMGLEPAEKKQNSLSPGIEALAELSRQIHRYGGWALQADSLPSSAIPQILAGPCDFCREDTSGLLAMFGLMAADGRPLARLCRDWIDNGVAVSRLARGMGEAPVRILSGEWEAIKARLGENPPNWTKAGAHTENGINRAKFLLAWRIGLPGLVFIGEETASELVPWLSASLESRKKAELANGSLHSVTRGNGGGFGLLSRLPGGGFWLFACNFGRNPDRLAILLPEPATGASDAATGTNLGSNLDGDRFTLALDGQAAINVLFK